MGGELDSERKVETLQHRASERGDVHPSEPLPELPHHPVQQFAPHLLVLPYEELDPLLGNDLCEGPSNRLLGQEEAAEPDCGCTPDHLLNEALDRALTAGRLTRLRLFAGCPPGLGRNFGRGSARSSHTPILAGNQAGSGGLG